MHVVNELMNRHEFDRSDAEPLEVTDDRWMCESQVASSKLDRHVGMFLRETLYVSFVNHGHIPRCPKRLFILPIKTRICDYGSRDVWGGIQVVTGTLRAKEMMGEYSLIPFHPSLNASGIGVQKEL